MKQLSQLRQLANLAKQRMRDGNYKELVNQPKNSFSGAVTASKYFICNARALKKEYIKPEIVLIDLQNKDFEDRVINLIKSNDNLFNPLGILADENAMISMDELTKQQYILKLSEDYLKIKEQYLNSKTA